MKVVYFIELLLYLFFYENNVKGIIICYQSFNLDTVLCTLLYIQKRKNAFITKTEGGCNHFPGKPKRDEYTTLDKGLHPSDTPL